MKRKKKQKSDYISDEDFQRMMKLQMATTREEVIKILRTDPNLTEERIQRMMEIWKEEPEKKSPSKGISQEAINTLLDLSLTTEEALNKSAEITIREAEEIAKLNKSEKESRDDMIHRWSMTNDLQEFVTLGKELHPEITEKFWTLVFKDSYKTKEEKANQQYGRPTLEDFFAATGRQEKEAILQKMYGGTLTPEEIEGFFPKDDD